MWLIAESKTGYIPNYIVYTGKLSEENVDPELDDHNQDFKVVMALMKPYLDLGHHIYFDNLFTSLQLLEDLITLMPREQFDQTGKATHQRSNLKSSKLGSM